ncbi:DUF3606 domain-containing protein [Luteolibacter sp. Y139]|uniref:DUF3606 domain-containing protein n=2 Tax=Luteolibacter soli TaxID=3135280 RepID=A0ABU9B358_9BACT
MKRDLIPFASKGGDVNWSAMSDDKSKTGGPDRQRINTSEEYEVQDWSKKFGVTTDQLKDAVDKVGPMADDVRRELGK